MFYMGDKEKTDNYSSKTQLSNKTAKVWHIAARLLMAHSFRVHLRARDAAKHAYRLPARDVHINQLSLKGNTKLTVKVHSLHPFLP